MSVTYFRMDMDLTIMEDTYQLFNQFKIYVPKDDQDRIDGLRYSFNRMLDLVNSIY